MLHKHSYIYTYSFRHGNFPDIVNSVTAVLVVIFILHTNYTRTIYTGSHKTYVFIVVGLLRVSQSRVPLQHNNVASLEIKLIRYFYTYRRTPIYEANVCSFGIS